MQASNSKKYLFAFTLLSTIALNGCQVVSLKQQAVDVTIANERNSILTQKKLSEASLNVLSMSGKEPEISFRVIWANRKNTLCVVERFGCIGCT
jgi:hypothetical protein